MYVCMYVVRYMLSWPSISGACVSVCRKLELYQQCHLAEICTQRQRINPSGVFNVGGWTKTELRVLVVC